MKIIGFKKTKRFYPLDLHSFKWKRYKLHLKTPQLCLKDYSNHAFKVENKKSILLKLSEFKKDAIINIFDEMILKYQ